MNRVRFQAVVFFCYLLAFQKPCVTPPITFTVGEINNILTVGKSDLLHKSYCIH